ncbi:MAG TPA: DUF4157 domain-containing protein [Acetobacteraceae bacterium]|nr:DUF4157 domain-containing protein [Acetobacteraceae bacterium]
MGSIADPLEHEAERIAKKLIRMPDPQTATKASAVGMDGARDSLRRTCAACAAHEDETITCAESPSGGDLLRSPDGPPPTIASELERRLRALDKGRPLAAAARTFFEPRLGYDFGGVRVHVDEDAHSVAGAVSARAFTIGRDIVFARGEYKPESADGRHLLAHELTHVVQQGAAQQLPAGTYSLRLQSEGGEQIIGPPLLGAALEDKAAASVPNDEDQVEALMPDGFAAVPVIQPLTGGAGPMAATHRVLHEARAPAAGSARPSRPGAAPGSHHADD